MDYYPIIVTLVEEWRKRHETSSWIRQLKGKGIFNEDFWDE